MTLSSPHSIRVDFAVPELLQVSLSACRDLRLPPLSGRLTQLLVVKGIDCIMVARVSPCKKLLVIRGLKERRVLAIFSHNSGEFLSNSFPGKRTPAVHVGYSIA